MTCKLYGSEKKQVLLIVAVYVIFSTLWIYFSDRLLFLDIPTRLQAAISFYKGLLFVILSAGLLHLLITGYSRRLKEASQASEERFRLIADSMPNFVWTSRPDGMVDYVNKVFKEYTGLERYDDRAIIHPDDRALTEAAWRNAMLTGTSYEIEHRFRRHDGIYRWYLCRAVPMRDNEGKIIKWYGTSTDIDDLKTAKERIAETVEALERTNHELQQFAYVASHDLQEPLRNVTRFMELFARRYKDRIDDRANTYIRFAMEGANRIHALVSDLLVYSELGAAAREFKQVSMGAVAEEAKDNLRQAIKECGALILLEELPEVMGNRRQLVQLLQNLLSNALKFGRNGFPPIIRISASKSAEEWIFAIRDNGVGIEPQYFDRIFVIFQRLHGRSEYPGTGIGLAICRKIIELHGGKIWVESRVGEGTTFYFTIPARGGTQ